MSLDCLSLRFLKAFSGKEHVLSEGVHSIAGNFYANSVDYSMGNFVRSMQKLRYYMLTENVAKWEYVRRCYTILWVKGRFVNEVHQIVPRLLCNAFRVLFPDMHRDNIIVNTVCKEVLYYDAHVGPFKVVFESYKVPELDGALAIEARTFSVVQTLKDIPEQKSAECTPSAGESEGKFLGV